MIKALWHTSKTSSDYLPITISIISWLMVFIQGRWIFKPFIKDVFHNIEKGYAKSSVHFCAETVRICTAASEYIFVQKPWKKMCSWYFFYVEDPRKFQTESVNTIELPWVVAAVVTAWPPKQSFLISFLLLFWYPHPTNYIVHQRCYEKSSVHFVQKPWTTTSERKCAADIFLYWRLYDCF